MTETTVKSENRDITESRAAGDVSPFYTFERYMKNLFNGGIRPFSLDWPTFAEMEDLFDIRAPKVDIIDQEKQIVIKAEIPGVDRKDLDISLSENSITIKGATRSETKQEKDNFLHREIRQGSFSRTLSLPCAVDAEGATARFVDGLLELTLPKDSQTKARKIVVD
ncbi:MAG: Hsp20/alpha crystallin family protein [Gammaproteobacteria bacterium]|nr:Hsp20/alpha crystallin family protein [Gammaproteobacteria bacterium]